MLPWPFRFSHVDASASSNCARTRVTFVLAVSPAQQQWFFLLGRGVGPPINSGCEWMPFSISRRVRRESKRWVQDTGEMFFFFFFFFFFFGGGGRERAWQRNPPSAPPRDFSGGSVRSSPRSTAVFTRPSSDCKVKGSSECVGECATCTHRHRDIQRDTQRQRQTAHATLTESTNLKASRRDGGKRSILNYRNTCSVFHQ